MRRKNEFSVNVKVAGDISEPDEDIPQAYLAIMCSSFVGEKVKKEKLEARVELPTL